MTQKNKVIVVGGDHHNTLGVVESLGQKGVRSFVILHTPHVYGYVVYSKYVQAGWCCQSEEDIISTLLANFQDKKNKAVIIATNDIVATILDNNFESLRDYFIIPTTTPAGTLHKCMSKEFMSSLAREVGLDVPETWVIHDGIIPQDIIYPVITKAISSVDGSKDNICICRGELELRDFLKDKSRVSIIQAQRFIEKDFEFQLLGCSLNSGKTVLIPGRTHIDRPKGLDNTFFLKFDKCEPEFEETINKSVLFVQKVKYTGLFSIEFLRDKNNGKNYFTEMNFRNDGNAVCVTKAGTNLPYIFYLSQIGEDFHSELHNSTISTVYLNPEVYYFGRMLSGEVSFREWVNNVRRTNCNTTFFKDDKKPFIMFLWNALRKRITGK